MLARVWNKLRSGNLLWIHLFQTRGFVCRAGAGPGGAAVTAEQTGGSGDARARSVAQDQQINI